jgi:hypothetical protein
MGGVVNHTFYGKEVKNPFFIFLLSIFVPVFTIISFPILFTLHLVLYLSGRKGFYLRDKEDGWILSVNKKSFMPLWHMDLHIE